MEAAFRNSGGPRFSPARKATGSGWRHLSRCRLYKNVMVRYILAIFMLIPATSFIAAAQTREAPKGWKEIKECGVSFLVPKDMKKMRDEATPIDSCFGSYKNSSMRLGFDHDYYMRQPEEAAYESLEIDGYRARLVTNANYLQVYVKYGEGDDARFFFGMSVSFKKSDNAQTARKIIESIRFIKGG
jgi:hypothetical protein